MIARFAGSSARPRVTASCSWAGAAATAAAAAAAAAATILTVVKYLERVAGAEEGAQY